MTNKTYTINKTYKSHKTYVTYFAYAFLFALLFSFFPQSAPTVHAGALSRPPTNLGLVGYWPMDEGTGTQAGDASGNNNTGTITGAAWTAGKHGNALSFNGVDNYVNIGDKDIYSFTNGSNDLPFTLSAWIYYVAPYASVNNLTFPIISKYNNNSPFDGEWNIDVTASSTLGAAGSDQIIFQILDNTAVARIRVESQVSIPRSAWTYVSMTYDGSELSVGIHLYINGKEVAVDTNSSGYTGMTNRTSPVIIGNELKASATYKSYANGKIDDARIYNRALTAAEISKLYSSGTAIRKGVSNSGLVGYWPMNEGKGNQVGDSSGLGNTGTITGATWTDGKRGKALSFNGSSYASIAGTNTNNFNFSSTVTIGFWMKGLTNLNTVILEKSSNNTHYHFQTTNEAMNGDGNHILFGVSVTPSSGRVSSAKIVSDGNWHYVVGTFDTSVNTLKIYIDGTLDKSNTGATDEIITNSQPLLIGSRSGSSGFPGVIDDIRVYNRVLSAAEIQSLYKQNSTTIGTSYENRLTNGLVGFWTMNGKDISGTTLLDKSGQGNDGTLTNMSAITSPVIGKVGQALNFNGTNNYITRSFTSSLAPTTLTYSAWIKPSALPAQYAWIGAMITNSSAAAGDWAVAVCGSSVSVCGGGALGNISVWNWNGANGSYMWNFTQNTIKVNEWTHVAVTRSSLGSEPKVYINGVLVSATSGPNTSGGGWPTGLEIGRADPSVSDYFYKGAIDEVRVYNRALSADEIEQLYNMGK